MEERNASKVETDNFRHHYHSLRCKSEDPDPFTRASYRRKALAQCFYAVHTLLVTFLFVITYALITPSIVFPYSPHPVVPSTLRVILINYRCDPDTACQIIENKLQAYHTVVDERGDKSVNNYASAALVLASNSAKNGTHETVCVSYFDILNVITETCSLLSSRGQ